MCNYVQKVHIKLIGLIGKFISSVHYVFMRMLLASHFIALLVYLCIPADNTCILLTGNESLCVTCKYNEQICETGIVLKKDQIFLLAHFNFMIYKSM